MWSLPRSYLCLLVLHLSVCYSLQCIPLLETCRKALVFEETFNSPNLNKWKYTTKYADYPDYEFVIYGSWRNNTYKKNEVLYLKPTLLSEYVGEEGVYKGKLDLYGYPPKPQMCTEKVDSGLCNRLALGLNILPPILSSKLISKQSFLYGSFEIRAKMPVGDWIYPIIELTPDPKKYGRSSGSIIIALTRGNQELKLAGTDTRIDFGTKWLEGGLFPTTYSPKNTTTMYARYNLKGWDQDFHWYRLDWYPGILAWSVDGEEYGRLNFTSNIFLPWANTKMAPFDEKMKIALGVGVGGIQRFPDGISSFNHQKPWRNKSPKNMLKFWKDKSYWYPSWEGDKTALKVDSVRVFTYQK